MLITKENQNIYDLGWLIGFWVGEGYCCIAKPAGRRTCNRVRFGISQKEMMPLLVARDILNTFNIKTSIYSRKTRNLNDLYFSHVDSLKFAKLLSNYPTYSDKREKQIENAIVQFKKLELWDNYNDKVGVE